MVQSLEVGSNSASVRLDRGGSLAQTFRSRGWLLTAAACIPTWLSTTSGVTLVLRQGDTSGPVIGSITAQHVLDNGWLVLRTRGLPPGDYTLELVDPIGTVGWWSEPHLGQPEWTAEPGWIAYRDGQAFLGVYRLRLEFVPALRSAWWQVSLVGRSLTFTGGVDDGLHLTVPQASTDLAPVLRLPWSASGYDVSPVSGITVSYFLSDTGQFMPVHELKRRTGGVPDLAVERSLRIGGNGDADLLVEGSGGTVTFSMGPDTLEPQFLGFAKASFTLTAVKHVDQPPGLPWISTGSSQLDGDLNRFLHERAFSPSAGEGGQPTWWEWMGLIRAWSDTALANELRAQLEDWRTNRIDADGYVWSWNDQPGWPLDLGRNIGGQPVDTRHFDTNARYILGAYRYFCWRDGTDAYLQRILPTLRIVMDYQLNQLGGRHGLLVLDMPWHRGTARDYASNYWDDTPFGYQDAYENIYFYASLLKMAELETAAGEGSRASALRDLAASVRRNFNATFWNDSRGRYVATVDVDGRTHDFGFSYVNLEALAYGLGDAAQARRIFAWLDEQRTDSGEQDAYERFIFAPQVTTSDCSAWWYLDGAGAIARPAYGTQQQNGGAILYTSGYDLWARAQYLGPDNAWARFQAILRRWRLDHLCGGSPLARGENNGWQVGTDIPFPESGLAPVAVLYAFLGMDVYPHRLDLTPRLPSSVPHLQVTGVTYQGSVLRIKADHQRLSIRGSKGQRLDVPYRAGQTFSIHTV